MRCMMKVVNTIYIIHNMSLKRLKRAKLTMEMYNWTNGAENDTHNKYGHMNIHWTYYDH